MKNKIIIKRNPNGDTRTAKRDVTFEEFHEANSLHRWQVMAVLDALGRNISNRGAYHDYTKVTQERMFYNDFLKTMNEGASFIDLDWYKMHVMAERHHLLDNCPEDVDLVDVLEMIVDCVCAGLERSGEVRELEIDNAILEKAIRNTVELVKGMIKLEDE